MDEHRKHALFVALCAGAVGFCVAFVAPAFYPLRVLWYYPLEHRFTFAVTPDGLAMDWFGRVLGAALVGGLVYALTGWIARRLKAISPGALVLWPAWLLTAALLSMALFTYQLARRHPRPLPLPAWYEPL